MTKETEVSVLDDKNLLVVLFTELWKSGELHQLRNQRAH